MEKSEYTGSPVKVCIDMRKTKCTGVLQGTVPFLAPPPEDELECSLALTRMQRVDLTALIADMGQTRREMTAHGQKDIVDVTFVDGSKQAGRQEQVKAQLAMFFETSANGAARLQSLRDLRASNRAVAFLWIDMHPAGRRALRVQS